MTNLSPFDLTGQVALVTGAARVAWDARFRWRWRRQEPTWPWGYATYRPAENWRPKLSGMGRQALPLQMDVTRLDQISSAIDAVVARFGRLDILVNNAGRWMEQSCRGCDRRRI